MPRPDLPTLAAELAALAAADRRAILAGLTAEERERLHLPVATEASSAAAHSPWFEQLAAAARVDEGAMTPRTRAALLAVDSPPTEKVEVASGRSLLQVAGDLLAKPRAPR